MDKETLPLQLENVFNNATTFFKRLKSRATFIVIPLSYILGGDVQDGEPQPRITKTE